jgi:hypothetical protein
MLILERTPFDLEMLIRDAARHTGLQFMMQIETARASQWGIGSTDGEIHFDHKQDERHAGPHLIT